MFWFYVCYVYVHILCLDVLICDFSFALLCRPNPPTQRAGEPPVDLPVSITYYTSYTSYINVFNYLISLIYLILLIALQFLRVLKKCSFVAPCRCGAPPRRSARRSRWPSPRPRPRRGPPALRRARCSRPSNSKLSSPKSSAAPRETHLKPFQKPFKSHLDSKLLE